MLLEEQTTTAHGLYESFISGGAYASRFTQLVAELSPIHTIDRKVAIRTETRCKTRREIGVGAHLIVQDQVIGGVIGGGDEADVETLHKLAGGEIVGGKELVELIVDAVCGVFIEWLVDAEHIGQRILHPVTHRRASIGIPVLSKEAEGVARLFFGEVLLAHTQLAERNTMSVHDTGHVVIRSDE